MFFPWSVREWHNSFNVSKYWYLLNIQSDLCAWHNSHRKFLQHRRDHTDTPRARPTGRERESNPLSLPQRSELAEKRTCPYRLGHHVSKLNPFYLTDLKLRGIETKEDPNIMETTKTLNKRPHRKFSLSITFNLIFHERDAMIITKRIENFSTVS